MSKANSKKLRKDEERVKLRQVELQSFRKALEREQQVVLDIIKIPKETRKKSPVKIHKAKPSTQSESEQCLSKLQEKFIKRYTELLKCKYRIKEILNKKPLPANSENEVLEKYKDKLESRTNEIKKSLASTESLKKLNIATSMVVLEKLIQNIEQELQEEPILNIPDDIGANMRIKKLQLETEGLEKEVSKLLQLIAKTDEDDIHGRNDATTSKQKSSCVCGTSCPKIVRFNKSANRLSD